MPKMVCSKCEIEFRCFKNDVEVYEYSWDGPYKFWAADEWECPDCGIKVIASFSQDCIPQHEVKDRFAEMMKRSADSGLLRNDFEDIEQRETMTTNKLITTGIEDSGADHDAT